MYGANGHALWEVVYYCLRAGELQSIAKIANSHLKNLPSCAAATVALLQLEKNKKYFLHGTVCAFLGNSCWFLQLFSLVLGYK